MGVVVQYSVSGTVWSCMVRMYIILVETFPDSPARRVNNLHRIDQGRWSYMLLFCRIWRPPAIQFKLPKPSLPSIRLPVECVRGSLSAEGGLLRYLVCEVSESYGGSCSFRQTAQPLVEPGLGTKKISKHSISTMYLTYSFLGFYFSKVL